MEELEVVAILDVFYGNETIGEMYKVTKVFPWDTNLLTVLQWALGEKQKRKYPENINVSDFRGNLRLTIKQ